MIAARRAADLVPGDVVCERRRGFGASGGRRKVSAVAFRRDGTGPVVVAFADGGRATYQPLDRVRVEVQCPPNP